MDEKEELFGKERSTIEKMELLLAEPENAQNPLRGEMEKTLAQYKKLLRQTEKLVVIGDRIQRELNETNEKLASSEQKFRNIFESAAEGIFQANLDGSLVSANPAMAAILERPTCSELICCGPHSFMIREQWEELLSKMEEGRGQAKFTYSMHMPDGRKKWLEVRAIAVAGADDGVFRIDGLVGDVTHRKELEDTLTHLAIIDGLTGVYNRRHFYELVTVEIQKSSRYKTRLSAVMIDIDHFKKINDTHGHDAGDRILEQFARILKDNLRVDDIIGRVGGEEFCVLMPNAGIEGAATAANNLRKRVEEYTFRIHGGTLKVTASLGVSEKPERFPDVTTLMKTADKALYLAKTNGRNRVEVYG